MSYCRKRARPGKLRRVINPADKALVDAFLSVAMRQRRDRSNKLLEEFDRLNRIEGAALIRSEPIEFRKDDPDFGRAVKTALLLVPNTDESQIDYVSFRPVRSDAGKRSIYVVFNHSAHRPMAGAEAVVSEAAWVNAWMHVGVP